MNNITIKTNAYYVLLRGRTVLLDLLEIRALPLVPRFEELPPKFTFFTIDFTSKITERPLGFYFEDYRIWCVS